MQHFTTPKTGTKKATPQMQPIPGRTDQVKNYAGGFVFEVTPWVQLDRFLILGTEGGTYYASEKKLNKEAAKNIKSLIKTDGLEFVKHIADVSDAGRAPKNDPALFALAMAATYGDVETKQAAYKALPRVARIGTHLFHFMQYVKDLDGPTGKGFQRAIQKWYLEKEVGNLAFQLVKYQSRDGWSHRDVLRLARPKPVSQGQQMALHWAVKGKEKVELLPISQVHAGCEVIWAFEKLKTLTNPNDAAKIIAEYRMPHEAVPNELKDQPVIWEALLESMKPEAVLRNLNKMTSIGLITNMSAAGKKVIEMFSSAEALKKARLHPMKILIGLKTYQQGHGTKGKLTWTPVPKMVDVLDKAFYLAFGAVEPTGKRMLLALDVSGSMGSAVGGQDNLSCREAAAAMALVTANVEPNWEIVGFTSGSSRSMHVGYNTGISKLDISPRRRLDDVVRYMAGLDFGGTDCALPMVWAAEKKLDFDLFSVYTDNETWAGTIQPNQALKQYRQKRSIPAKSVVVAMTGTQFTIADPTDAGMMDVVGFDTATPELISDFASH